MATVVKLDDDVQAYVDGLVLEGRYNSAEEVVAASVRRMQADDGPLSDEDLQAVREGMADADAGRVRDAEEVFAELRRRFQTP